MYKTIKEDANIVAEFYMLHLAMKNLEPNVDLLLELALRDARIARLEEANALLSTLLEV